MAEVALTSVAKSALTLLSSLAKDEFLLLWNSPKELQKLQTTIETIGDLLQDAEKMQSKGDAVLSCLSRLRNVMYDADDLFDSMASDLLRKRTMSGAPYIKEVRLFFSHSNQVATFFKTAHQVKSLKESLDQVKADMNLCGFQIRQPRVVQQQVMRFDRDKTHSFVHQEDVIGRDQDRDRIVSMLLSNPEDEASTSRGRAVSVVAVIGFGGLGKTTLAQLVYNDKRVRSHFDLCLWACINYLSDLEQALIEIIAASDGVKHNDMGLEKLQEKLRTMIGGKKFLLVVDDLWDENCRNWLQLDSILRCGVSCKVLVTTRSAKVAESLDAPKSSCVNLEVLSEESAWSLFVKRAFYEDEASQYPELEALGRKIVSRCGNVPLAIIVVGSLLRYRKREVRVWSDFLDCEMGRVLSDSAYHKTQNSVRGVLIISYNDLHPSLKLCFAYCSLFPKDYKFEKDLLVRLWISQGFVKVDDDNTQSLEELGETYFFYLVDRCFFQQLSEQSGSYVLTYVAKMHDLLHDMAKDVARPEMMSIDKDHIDSGKRVGLRHVSLHPEIDASFNYCSLVSDPIIVRTIYLFKPTKFLNISHGSLHMLFTSFRMLRTLRLSGFRNESVPDSIGELIHLRYLDLSESRILKCLPNSICKLHHLMTLDIYNCIKLEILPSRIGKLIRLRHLSMLGCEALKSLPHELASLTSLVNLDQLIVHRESGGLRYLKNLNDLSGCLLVKLPREIWHNAVEDAKMSNMSEKHKLKRLLIIWKVQGVRGTGTEDEVEAVMEALEPSQNLEQLDIRNYSGEKLPRWLFMIKNVKELMLEDCDHVKYLEDEMKDSICFASLRTLKIYKMGNLNGWWRQEMLEESHRPCFSKLMSLTIRDCPKLKGKLPRFGGIEHLSLQGVGVQWVSELISVNPSCYDISSKLKRVRLRDIEGLVCLPETWICHLTAIERLEVESCGDLKWVSRRGLANLTALKHLAFEDCKYEIRDEDDDREEVEVGMPWKSLERLQTLEIPNFDTHFREGLVHLTLLKDLRIEEKINGENFVFQSNALPNLRTLEIVFEGDQTFELRKSGIQNLPLLAELAVEGCKEICLSWKTLLVSMKLVTLKFTNVQNVIVVEDTVVEQSQLCNLIIVSFKRTDKWVHNIPWKSLASLVNISLAFGKGEMEEQLLPDQIQHLSSLQVLEINGGCEKVRSVPQWFPRLNSLRSLYIRGCSEELKMRCEKEKGEDWPLISHISNRIIVKSSDELMGEWSTSAPVQEGLKEESEVRVRRKMGCCGLKR